MYYIIYNGQQVGPMDAHSLKYYGLNPQSDIRVEGSSYWVKAFTIPALMELISDRGSTPPPYGQQGYPYNAEPEKSKVAAGLFAIFLGWIGLQYFYVGKIGGGVICILLTIFTCGLWNIISLIQGILFLTMTQEEFERKFVYSNSTFPLF